MAYRVLIVDDSPVTRKIVAKSIGMSGLDVGEILQAGSGKEALALMASTKFDVVFADINMPEMSGVEMVERMAQSATLSSLPVVVISTERSQERIQRLSELGVKAYLTKPFRPEELLRVVGELLPAGGAK